MWKPWEWASASQAAALANARSASTALSRQRVERDDVELYLAGVSGTSGRGPASEVGSGEVRTAGAG